MPKKALILIFTMLLLVVLCTACGRGNTTSSGANSGSGSSGGTMGGSSSGMGGSGSSGGTMGGSSSGMGGSGSTGGTAGGSGSAGLGGMDDPLSGGASGSLSGDMSGSSGVGSGSSGANSGSGSGANSGSSSNSNSTSDSSSAAATAAAGGDAWMTRLVNAATPLPDGFTVETVRIKGYDERLFDKRAAGDLEAMLDDAEAAGCKLYLVSGYRSVERQAALFKRKTNSFLAEGFDQAEAERQAAMWVARPGTSEHNTGLAADIVSADWYSSHDDLTADFEETPEFAWLSAHCAEYGFILRYPKGKENVTGITYEPWHYRYVGKDAAARIMADGSTLEEYNGAA